MFRTNLVNTILLVFILTIPFSFALAQKKVTIKNIVIVHGAFADASGWENVYQILKQRGFNVTLVQNPLTSLKDDVKATLRALERCEGQAVLVGHSWGGSVITEAGMSPKVSSLVYVAAFIPDINESTLDLIQTAPPLPKNGILPPDSNGLVYFDKAKFRECFAAEQSESKAAFLADSQQPIVGSSFSDRLSAAAWKTKPVFAIVATQDKSIHPDLERRMCKRAKAKTTELSGSHTVFMSNALSVANIIEEAARIQEKNIIH